MGCLYSKEQLTQQQQLQQQQQQGAGQQQQQQQQQQQHPPAGGTTALTALLAQLQDIGSTDTSDSNSPPHTGAVPQDVLKAVDEALQALQAAVVPGSGAAAATQNAVRAAQPHVDSLAEVAAAVKGAIWDAKDGAFLSTDAWQALGGSAAALLSVCSTLTYIGPVFALFGYAIKQWSTCQEVPQEAVDLLQSCRDLLFDLNRAWPHIMSQQQQQRQQQRLQRWLRLVAEAAAQCVVINSKRPIMRFASAEVHTADLASKTDLLRYMRPQLSNLMEQIIADTAHALGDEADAVLGRCQRLMSLLPLYRPVPKLQGIEGRDELVKELHMQLLPGPGVRGLLLHGVSGAGKSTLATMLAKHFQQSGGFGGGVYEVTVQTKLQHAADTDTLLSAQHRLLMQITGKTEGEPGSLAEGAQLLAEALRKTISSGPVLLVVDNVPEGTGAILELLPCNLQTCVAEGSRVLFTSHNQAAVGLSDISFYCVGCLSKDAATRVLLADGVRLSHEQLEVALAFCGGLPLALTLLHGALHGALREGRNAESILERVQPSNSISHGKQEKLREALRFSVECLSKELQNTWLDLALLRLHVVEIALLPEGCSLFEPEHLHDLQQRNLVDFKGLLDVKLPLDPAAFEVVVVHDVLRCMAGDMCGPDSEHYYYIADKPAGNDRWARLGQPCSPLPHKAGEAAPHLVGVHYLEAFKGWLAASTTGMLLVPGEWFEQLQQLPDRAQQSYIDALAELGYMQLTESEAGVIVVSPSGLSCVQDMLQDVVLQVQRDSSDAVHGDVSNTYSLQDEDKLPQSDQGNQAQQQQPAGASNGSGSSAAAGGSGNKQQPGDNKGNSNEQDGAAPGQPGSAAVCLPELSADTCVRLCLSSAPWRLQGLEPTCQLEDSNSTRCSDTLPLEAQFKCLSNDAVELNVLMKMEACMQREKNHTAVGFKLTHVDANAHKKSSLSAATSSSSSSSSSSTLSAFMYFVRLSLEGQQEPPGSEGPKSMPLMSCNKESTLSQGKVNRTISYTFKEDTFRATATGSAAGLAAMVGVDRALKEKEVGTLGTDLALITVNPAAQVAVGNWGHGSPCTVEVLRHPLNTLLCCSTKDELGVIKTNPGNHPDRELSFKMYPREGCLEQGRLRDGVLKVKIAVLAVGGVIKDCGSGLMRKGAVREVAMRPANNIQAGTIISLGPPLPPLWQYSAPDCQVHAPLGPK